ncbi:hypothetical protein HHK36_002016 [Tetracentron sinense]|uniref:Uncharacterized protein n=1 Tax=Tetracentron sinense TaxID=13715 RepID=A0A835DVK5_TETSI|nr:hypothetical protein HHK36_002016 [Tetracentron sinense]
MEDSVKQERGINGVEEDGEETFMEGIAVLDFDMLCSTVALQTQGKWGNLEQTDENGAEIGGVQRMWEGDVLHCFEDRRIALETAFCPCYRFGKNMGRAGFGSCSIQGTVYFIIAVTAILNYISFTITRRHCFLYLAVSFTILSGTYLGNRDIKKSNNKCKREQRFDLIDKLMGNQTLVWATESFEIFAFMATGFSDGFRTVGLIFVDLLLTLDICRYLLLLHCKRRYLGLGFQHMVSSHHIGLGFPDGIEPILHWVAIVLWMIVLTIYSAPAAHYESRTLEINNVQDGVWHGRGDTICIGSYGEGSKAFFELRQPTLIPTESPDHCSMQRATNDSDHPWTVEIDHSDPLVPASQ